MHRLYAAYLIRRTRREARRMMRAARRSKGSAMPDHTFRDGMNYMFDAADQLIQRTPIPATPSVQQAVADTDPHPNPNVYSDEHTGPLVIVYTD